MFLYFCCLLSTDLQTKVIETHVETAPSLRIDKPFPALLEYAATLDFQNIDVPDHGHIPYVIILVRVLEEWKKKVRHVSCKPFTISIGLNTVAPKYSITVCHLPPMLKNKSSRKPFYLCERNLTKKILKRQRHKPTVHGHLPMSLQRFKLSSKIPASLT